MTEPTGSAEAAEPGRPPLPEEAAPPTAPAGPAEPQPAGFAEYGAYTPQAPAEPAPPGDPLRGLLAGAGAAVLGAIVWGLVVYVTEYEIGFLALFIGYGVGYAVHRVGRVATTGAATAAAALAAGGILLGFVLTALAIVAKVVDVGFFDAVNLTSDRIGWGRLLSTSISGLDWAFLAIGAFAAYRLVAQQRRPGKRA